VARDEKKFLEVEIGADYSQAEDEEETAAKPQPTSQIKPAKPPSKVKPPPPAKSTPVAKLPTVSTQKSEPTASSKQPASSFQLPETSPQKPKDLSLPSAISSGKPETTPPKPTPPPSSKTAPPISTTEISATQTPIQTQEEQSLAPTVPSTTKTARPIEEAQEKSAAKEGYAPLKKKILLVDDDELLLDIHREVFKANNFEVFVARDGKEAWEWLVKNKKSVPDVILTGIMMPRMNGFELIAKMKEEPEFIKIPVAIFSHRGLPEHEKKARELQVNDFIVQGITPPPEVVRRVLILLGVHTNFRIAFSTEKEDGAALFNLLNKERADAGEKQCKPAYNKEAELELEETAEKGKFKIKLICE
jgi:DNA-binding response OmpR family regulator